MNIKERVLAHGDLAPLRAAKDVDALAVALNANAPLTYQERFITERALLTKCPDGIAILTALYAAQSNMAVACAIRFLGQDAGLDIGDPGAHALLDQLQAANILQPSWVVQIKNLSLKPLYVTREQVLDALYNNDGSEK